LQLESSTQERLLQLQTAIDDDRDNPLFTEVIDIDWNEAENVTQVKRAGLPTRNQENLKITRKVPSSNALNLLFTIANVLFNRQLCGTRPRTTYLIGDDFMQFKYILQSIWDKLLWPEARQAKLAQRTMVEVTRLDPKSGRSIWFSKVHGVSRVLSAEDFL
jgi:hypothetical protein